MKFKFVKPYRRYRIIAATIVSVAIAVAFIIGGRGLGVLSQIQFGPLLVDLLTGGTILTAVLFVIVALFTFIFGRFFCSVICPLGILQDVIDAFSPRKSALKVNLRLTRYIIAALCFGLLVGGCGLGLDILEPYSNFGAFFSSLIAHMKGVATTKIFYINALLPIVLIMLLVIWKRRVFCTTICPVGTILGLISRRGLLRLRIDDKCSLCGLCDTVCCVGAIDAATGTVDNERCVRCMDCVSVCRGGAIGFARPIKTPDQPVDRTRRAALISGAVTVTTFALAAGGGLALTKRALAAPDDDKARRILPPGADRWSSFAARCINCQLCVVNCPSHIIKPGTVLSGAVTLDLTTASCDYNCTRCADICPTNAIAPITLEKKRRTRIALAKFDASKCRLVIDEIECGLCAKACPTGAVTIKKYPTGMSVPKLNADQCIGCGACAVACPVTPKAMTIEAIDKQVEIAKQA